MKRTVITAKELGITIERKERELFKWFLASYLFGKRIQQDVAVRTWEIFMKKGIDSPKRIASKSQQQLVELLGEGNYRRFDESTAHNMLDMAKELVRDHHGNLLNMFDGCDDTKDFEMKLLKLKGVGPKTAEIFMREARPVLVAA